MQQIAQVLLPTTMVGSYPRPRWYTHRLGNQDIREALMEQNWREEYEDAAAAVIRDQERAGLDIVSDGEVYEDDLVGGAGWPEYVISRIGGVQGRADSRIAGALDPTPILEHLFNAWPTPILAGPVTRGPLRFAYLYQLASRLANRPVKMSFADAQFIAPFFTDEHYGGQPGQPSPRLRMDLASIYNQELR